MTLTIQLEDILKRAQRQLPAITLEAAAEELERFATRTIAAEPAIAREDLIARAAAHLRTMAE